MKERTNKASETVHVHFLHVRVESNDITKGLRIFTDLLTMARHSAENGKALEVQVDNVRGVSAHARVEIDGTKRGGG